MGVKEDKASAKIPALVHFDAVFQNLHGVIIYDMQSLSGH